MPKKSTTMDIINGIAAAVANTHDGALDDEGNPQEIGLRREEGRPLLDQRVMDGFRVKLHGNKLCIMYHSECKLKDVHDKRFEGDVEDIIDNIEKFIKKEYRKVTKQTLGLKKEGETDIMMQYVSRVRSFVQATRWYKVNSYEKGVEEVGVPSDEKRIEDGFKKFLALGEKSPKPKNVTNKIK